jgi:hypothetical protein
MSMTASGRLGPKCVYHLGHGGKRHQEEMAQQLPTWDTVCMPTIFRRISKVWCKTTEIACKSDMCSTCKGLTKSNPTATSGGIPDSGKNMGAKCPTDAR